MEVNSYKTGINKRKRSLSYFISLLIMGTLSLAYSSIVFNSSPVVQEFTKAYLSGTSDLNSYVTVKRVNEENTGMLVPENSVFGLMNTPGYVTEYSYSYAINLNRFFSDSKQKFDMEAMVYNSSFHNLEIDISKFVDIQFEVLGTKVNTDYLIVNSISDHLNNAPIDLNITVKLKDHVEIDDRNEIEKIRNQNFNFQIDFNFSEV